MGISLVGYSLPSFFIGLVLLFFVVIKWQLLPFPSYVSPFENPVQFFQTMILPWIVLAILNAAFYMRLTRNQMLETLGEDYIRTARAKGLPERTVVIASTRLRAGLTPIVTAAGLDLAGLLGGAIITESIFSLPGLGSLAVDSVIDSDLPVIVGDHPRRGHVHHRRQPDRRPALRGHRPASEARMTDRPHRRRDASGPSSTSSDLTVKFPTEDGLVRAVDGVSFIASSAARRSPSSASPGSGKSVTAQAIMGLLNREPAKVTGEVWLDGHELHRA